MKEDLLDSAIIVASATLLALGLGLIILIPGIEANQNNLIAQRAMERISVLVTAMNRLPLFYDMKLVDKWFNIKPEYDAILDGILFNIDPKHAELIRAQVRVKTNELLKKGLHQ